MKSINQKIKRINFYLMSENQIFIKESASPVERSISIPSNNLEVLDNSPKVIKTMMSIDKGLNTECDATNGSKIQQSKQTNDEEKHYATYIGKKVELMDSSTGYVSPFAKVEGLQPEQALEHAIFQKDKQQEIQNLKQSLGQLSQTSSLLQQQSSAITPFGEVKNLNYPIVKSVSLIQTNSLSQHSQQFGVNVTPSNIFVLQNEAGNQIVVMNQDQLNEIQVDPAFGHQEIKIISSRVHLEQKQEAKKKEHTAETYNENVQKNQRQQSSHLSNKIQPVYNGEGKEVVSGFTSQNKSANDIYSKKAPYSNPTSSYQTITPRTVGKNLVNLLKPQSQQQKKMLDVQAKQFIQKPQGASTNKMGGFMKRRYQKNIKEQSYWAKQNKRQQQEDEFDSSSENEEYNIVLQANNKNVPDHTNQGLKKQSQDGPQTTGETTRIRTSAKNSYYIITEEDMKKTPKNKDEKTNLVNEAFSLSPHSKTYHLRIQNMLSPLTNRTSNQVSSKREEQLKKDLKNDTRFSKLLFSPILQADGFSEKKANNIIEIRQQFSEENINRLESSRYTARILSQNPQYYYDRPDTNVSYANQMPNSVILQPTVMRAVSPSNNNGSNKHQKSRSLSKQVIYNSKKWRGKQRFVYDKNQLKYPEQAVSKKKLSMAITMKFGDQKGESFDNTYKIDKNKRTMDNFGSTYVGSEFAQNIQERRRQKIDITKDVDELGRKSINSPMSVNSGDQIAESPFRLGDRFKHHNFNDDEVMFNTAFMQSTLVKQSSLKKNNQDRMIQIPMGQRFNKDTAISTKRPSVIENASSVKNAIQFKDYAQKPGRETPAHDSQTSIFNGKGQGSPSASKDLRDDFSEVPSPKVSQTNKYQDKEGTNDYLRIDKAVDTEVEPPNGVLVDVRSEEQERQMTTMLSNELTQIVSETQQHSIQSPQAQMSLKGSVELEKGEYIIDISNAINFNHGNLNKDDLLQKQLHAPPKARDDESSLIGSIMRSQRGMAASKCRRNKQKENMNTDIEQEISFDKKSNYVQTTIYRNRQYSQSKQKKSNNMTFSGHEDTSDSGSQIGGNNTQNHAQHDKSASITQGDNSLSLFASKIIQPTGPYAVLRQNVAAQKSALSSRDELDQISQNIVLTPNNNHQEQYKKNIINELTTKYTNLINSKPLKFGAVEWKEVNQKNNDENELQSKIRIASPPAALWKDINNKNWHKIKNFCDFYRDGITKENFNSVKIKPVRNLDPASNMHIQSNIQVQSPIAIQTNSPRSVKNAQCSKIVNQKQNLKQSQFYQSKSRQHLSKADLFRKRQRGLQTLCSDNKAASVTSGPKENEMQSGVVVSIMSQELQGPIMPKTYYGSQISVMHHRAQSQQNIGSMIQRGRNQFVKRQNQYNQSMGNMISSPSLVKGTTKPQTGGQYFLSKSTVGSQFSFSSRMNKISPSNLNQNSRVLFKVKTLKSPMSIQDRLKTPPFQEGNGHLSEEDINGVMNQTMNLSIKDVDIHQDIAEGTVFRNTAESRNIESKENIIQKHPTSKLTGCSNTQDVSQQKLTTMLNPVVKTTPKEVPKTTRGVQGNPKAFMQPYNHLNSMPKFQAVSILKTVLSESGNSRKDRQTPMSMISDNRQEKTTALHQTEDVASSPLGPDIPQEIDDSKNRSNSGAGRGNSQNTVQASTLDIQKNSDGHNNNRQFNIQNGQQSSNCEQRDDKLVKSGSGIVTHNKNLFPPTARPQTQPMKSRQKISNRIKSTVNVLNQDLPCPGQGKVNIQDYIKKAQTHQNTKKIQ